MSDTDHPRFLGSHQVGHAPRSWREMGKGDRIEWGTPKRVVIALQAVTEVDEHLQETEPARCRFCHLRLEPVAEWEREQLAGSEQEAVLDFCDYTCMGDHDSLKADGFAWRSDDHEPFADAMYMGRERSDDDDSDEALCDNWMPLVSIEEAREIFGGSDFTIDHGGAIKRAKPAGRW